MRILFLGKLREAAGAGERIVAPPQGVATGADLIAWLAADDATLGAALSHLSVRIVADHEIVERSASLLDAREVAFLPPASGG